MWTLVYSSTYGYGLLKVVDDLTPLLAVSSVGSFFVKSLSDLHHVQPDESEFSTFTRWCSLANASILLEYHTDSCPIQTLKSYFPEYFI